MGKGNQILIVDDDLLIGEAVAETLKHHGYRTVLYHSPEQALTAFEQAPDAFSLIISDHNMPGITGLELLHAIHTVKPEISLMLISGLLPKNIPPHIMALSKPVSFETLVHFADMLLGIETSDSDEIAAGEFSSQPA